MYVCKYNLKKKKKYICFREKCAKNILGYGDFFETFVRKICQRSKSCVKDSAASTLHAAKNVRQEHLSYLLHFHFSST